MHHLEVAHCRAIFLTNFTTGVWMSNLMPAQAHNFSGFKYPKGEDGEQNEEEDEMRENEGEDGGK
jgi:hypothetical protein